MSNNDPSFLGKGWKFPIAFTAGGESVQMSCGQQNIDESLNILLGTEHLERLMRPYFGCSLRQFVYEGITQGTIGRIKDQVTNAIITGEPRIDLSSVKVSQAAGYDSVLLIDVDYVVRATNTRSNKVFPFYLQEQSLNDN